MTTNPRGKLLLNLTMWQAASRLADDMPSAKEIATAKYWAAAGGSRIGHAGRPFMSPRHRPGRCPPQAERTVSFLHSEERFGSVTVNRVPRPSSLCTATCPPSMSTKRLTVNKPKPNPDTRATSWAR
jgi:hypothetical protein